MIETAERTGPAHHRAARHRTPALRRWPAVVAYVALALPFGIVLGRFLASTATVYLPDDLALIDLHTRNALSFQQQLGPFDRFGWNHPGPALFYLLSIPYRVLGNGARAQFVGAILINALAALAVVRVVHRRAGAWAALWSSACVGILLVALAPGGGFDVTYSEGSPGAVVSPWNPTVVIVPLLLTAVLCASAVAGAPGSWLGAALTGTFCVQSDVSTIPVVGVLLLVSGLVLLVPFVRRLVQDRGSWHGRWHWRWWAVAGIVLLVLAWIPPVVQQLTNHPGNLTQIYDFFNRSHPAHGYSAGLWSIVSVDSVLLYGPSMVTVYPLGTAAAHAGLVLTLALVVQLGAVAAAWFSRERFLMGLAGAGLVGSIVAVLSVTGIVGPIFGYLVLWEIAMPICSLVALGAALLRLLTRADPLLSVGRGAVALCVLATGTTLGYELATVPSLPTVSDPAVHRALVLVSGAERPGRGPLGVQDAGLSLIGTEQFIGLVNALDERNYTPRVSPFWKVQFGPALVQHGSVRRTVVLAPWRPSSPSNRGYLGRAGDLAVSILPGNGLA